MSPPAPLAELPIIFFLSTLEEAVSE